MIPTPPAQQEYIITEEQLQSFQRMGSFSNSFFQFVPMLADEIRSRPHTSTPEMCKHWVSSANLKSDFRDQDIGMCYCNKSMYEHDTAIRTEERNKILRLVESDEWQKEHDEQTRNQTLDKFKEVIRLHDEDELLYPDLYNEFLVIYKSLRKERP